MTYYIMQRPLAILLPDLQLQSTPVVCRDKSWKQLRLTIYTLLMFCMYEIATVATLLKFTNCKRPNLQILLQSQAKLAASSVGILSICKRCYCYPGTEDCIGQNLEQEFISMLSCPQALLAVIFHDIHHNLFTCVPSAAPTSHRLPE